MKNSIALRAVHFAWGILALLWSAASFTVYLQLPSREKLKTTSLALSHSGLNIGISPSVDSELRSMILLPWKYQRFRCGMKRYRLYEDMISEKLKSAKIPGAFSTIPLIETGYRNYIKGLNGGIWHSYTYSARISGLNISNGVDERLNVDKDTDFSIKMLLAFDHYFKNWPLVLIAYRMGPSFVEDAVTKTGENDPWKIAGQNSIAQKYLTEFMTSALLKESATVSKQSFEDTHFCDWF